MEEKKDSVSYFVHEGEMARMERHVKRWFIGWIVTFLALVLSNAGWIYYENQYEDVSTTLTQETTTDGNGDVTVNGVGIGDVNYGYESETDNIDKNTEKENP